MPRPGGALPRPRVLRTRAEWPRVVLVLTVVETLFTASASYSLQLLHVQVHKTYRGRRAADAGGLLSNAPRDRFPNLNDANEFVESVGGRIESRPLKRLKPPRESL